MRFVLAITLAATMAVGCDSAESTSASDLGALDAINNDATTVATSPDGAIDGDGATTLTDAPQPDANQLDANQLDTAVNDATTSDTNTSPSDVGSSDVPLGPLPPACVTPTEEGECRSEIEVGGSRLYYWYNYPLSFPTDDTSGGRLRRLVIIQHGNSRNPWSYYDSMVDAAVTAGELQETLIIAPYFMTSDDSPPVGYHEFTSGGWKRGDDAVNTGVSSFAIMDAIVVDHVLDNPTFPNIEEVVVTGHSAGGQFTQRYAVGTDVDLDRPNVDFRFIVANPGSYLYLDAQRWDQVSGLPACEPTASPTYSFVVPSGTACDDDYNEYKYGLDAIASGHYMTRRSASAQVGSYRDRAVTYFLGDADVAMTAMEDGGLDLGCEAGLQGQCRFDRGRIFADYMDQMMSPHNHQTVIVPGAGHSKSAMYESAEGVELVFPTR